MYFNADDLKSRRGYSRAESSDVADGAEGMLDPTAFLINARTQLPPGKPSPNFRKPLDDFVHGGPLLWIGLHHVFDKRFHEFESHVFL